jgi:hypothetical protein
MSYEWVAIDLDGAIAPADAVRLARRSWPRALVAVLSYRWSEDEQPARDEADHVIHKPVRAAELDALFARLRLGVGGVGAASAQRLRTVL